MQVQVHISLGWSEYIAKKNLHDCDVWSAHKNPYHATLDQEHANSTIKMMYNTVILKYSSKFEFACLYCMFCADWLQLVLDFYFYYLPSCCSFTD